MGLAPYKVVRTPTAFRHVETTPNRTWIVELELLGAMGVSGEIERLSFLTHIQEPIDAGQKAMAIAALEHLRRLLADQIEAMRSP